MLEKTTLAGHPVHPQVVTAPIGLFSFTAVMDVMHDRLAEHTTDAGLVVGR